MMPEREPNADPIQLGQFTEADLLAWIEGELVGPDSARLEAALAEHPRLDAWARALRADRWALGLLSDVAAPAGLVESTIERARHEALVGIAGSDSALIDGATVRSRYRLVRPSPLGERVGVVVRSRLVRRSALAAAAVLGLTLAGLWGATALQRWIGTRPVGGPALADRTRVPGAAGIESDASPRLADGGDVSEPGAQRVAKASAGGEAPAQTIRVATLDEALALVRSNRLVIRVRVAQDTAGLDRLVARSARTVGSWRVSDQPGAAIERIASAAFRRGLEELDRARETTPTMAADGDAVEGAGAGSAFVPRRARLIGVYRIQTLVTPGAIRSIRARLEAAGTDLRFEALDEAIVPTWLDVPEAVLWWDQPADAWVPRGTIPVIVERLE